MKNEDIGNKKEKLVWVTPTLDHLGEIGDVAGGSGLGVENMLQGS